MRKNMQIYLKIAAVLAGSLVTLSAWAGPPHTKQLVTNNGGYGLTAQADWLMVGEPELCVVHVYKLDYDTMLYGDGNGNAGAVYQNVVAGNFACPSVRNRGFGEVVSVDGELMVVGAPFAKGQLAEDEYPEDRAEDGTVYLYEFDGTLWVQLTQTFEAVKDNGDPLGQGNAIVTPHVAGAEFGSAVEVTGDLMVIGSRAESTDLYAGAGALYAYRVDRTAKTATLIAKLQGENAGDALGTAVTIWENQILAGVPGYDIPLEGGGFIENGGAAYLYEMNGDTPELIDLITTNAEGFDPPQNVGREVSNGEFIGLLAGEYSYPLKRDEITEEIVPKFEYERSDGGDVSQSEEVSAIGIMGVGVDIYPDVLNDNATQRENYHLEIDLSGGNPAPNMAEDIKIYKEFVSVNDSFSDQVQVLQFPCNYGGELRAHTWELVTVPCNVPPGTTVVEAFNADIFPNACTPTPCGVLGVYNTNWVVWGQNSDFTSPQPTVRLSATDTVQPGRGYWIMSDASLKPAGQPVYWNVDESNFPNPEAARIPLLTTSNPAGGALAANVAGYYQIELPDNIPAFQTTGVLLGNPFGRSFRWSQSYVQVESLFGDLAVPVGTVNLINPVFSMTAYIYNPDSDEGQPYDTVANTPGFSEVIPVNKGFWIRMNHGLLSINFGGLWLPYSK